MAIRRDRAVPPQRNRQGAGETDGEAMTSRSVDLRLLGRVANVAVRGFVEGVHGYRLVKRDAVEVSSSYRIPDAPGLQRNVPRWLAQRVQLGAELRPEVRRHDVRAVDVAWDRKGTRLILHLREPIAVGTPVFVFAGLGSEGGERVIDITWPGDHRCHG